MCLDPQDHGIHRDGSKETVDADSELARRTLSQDLNRHAAVVLEGRSLGNSGPNRRNFMMSLSFSLIRLIAQACYGVSRVRWYRSQYYDFEMVLFSGLAGHISIGVKQFKLFCFPPI
jgi:hypothetical protein